MVETNPGLELGNTKNSVQLHLYTNFIFLDFLWLNNVNINLLAVKKKATELTASRVLEGEYKAAWLLKAITCIDLTTLGGDDTNSNVQRLCKKVQYI